MHALRYIQINSCYFPLFQRKITGYKQQVKLQYQKPYTEGTEITLFLHWCLEFSTFFRCPDGVICIISVEVRNTQLQLQRSGYGNR